MTRRRLAMGALAVLALAGLALWWTGGRDGDGQARSSGPAAGKTSAVARSERVIDVATVARGTISGTVRDPAGAPVAAAQVCGSASSEHLSADDQRDPICAAAGADGRYRLAGLLPASYAVDASAPRFAPGQYRDATRRTSFRLAAGEEKHGIDIVLHPGGVEISGTVVDIGGGPIQDAWVSARSMAVGPVATARTRTLAGGAFRVWVAPGQVQLDASAEGYADGRATTTAPAEAVEILLTPESSLSGRAVEIGSGAPVAGARVVAGVSEDWGEGRGWTSTVTDDQGRFRFSRLPPGQYKPVATAPRGYGQARESVLLGLGQSVDDVIIEVHPAVAVYGRVLAAGDGAPCRSGMVSLLDVKRAQRRSGAIEEDGRVEIDGVLPGRHQVSVWCRDHLSDDAYPDLTVGGSSPPAQVWSVRAGGRIRGRVSAGGAPVAGARIMAVEQVGGDAFVFHSGGGGISDADGTFELGPLRAATYELEVRAPDHPPPDKPVVTVPPDGEANVDILLDQGGGVTGEVVDERGRPVAGVTVQARELDISRRMAMNRSTDGQTRSDGSFALRGLRAGSYRLIARRSEWDRGLRAPGKRRDDEPGEKVEVVAGGTARVRLVVESQDGVIRGRVADARGRPITDAFVDAERDPDSPSARSARAQQIIRWAWWRTPVLTDTSGAFAIEKLSPGTYTVRAYRRGGGEALTEGVAVGSSVTLTIRSTGSITGSVRGGSPEEIAVTVVDDKTGFSRRESFFRTAGAFTMRDLPPGSFVVLVTSAEGTGRTSAQLAEGQELTGVVVELARRATVTGRLVSRDDGAPLAGFVMIARAVDQMTANLPSSMTEERAPLQSGADGRFEIADAPAGRVEIMALPLDSRVSGYAYLRRVVVLEAGRTTDLGDLRVPRTRVKRGEQGGDLGFQLEQAPRDAVSPPLVVSAIRPDGPASGSGLQVGDTIVSVDGDDVRGDPDLFQTLSTVPPGTTVTLGLAREASARITAARPR